MFVIGNYGRLFSKAKEENNCSQPNVLRDVAFVELSVLFFATVISDVNGTSFTSSYLSAYQYD